MRKSVWGAVVSLALVSVACGGGGGSTGTAGGSGSPGGTVKEGGTLRIAAFDGIDSLNPYVGVNDDSYSAYEYIYPQLVQYDANAKFIPDFATAWTHSSDGLTWTFTTQANAKWSDGQPLTAADVAWTYNDIIKFKDSVTAGSSGVVQNLTKVEAPDDTHVKFIYSTPVPSVLANVQQTSIVPEHIWSKYAALGCPAGWNHE